MLSEKIGNAIFGRKRIPNFSGTILGRLWQNIPKKY